MEATAKLRPPTAPPAKRIPKKKKLTTQINLWIRRIHLFSGLFMLPWVLLYGFTALLFNHPTALTDTRTEILHFELEGADRAALPAPESLVALAVEAANEALGSGTITREVDDGAAFTRRLFGSLENDDHTASVILDVNTGRGYLRKRSKLEEEPATEEDPPPSLEAGLDVVVTADVMGDIEESVRGLLDDAALDAETMRVRSLPNIDFDARYGGEPVRLRLTQKRGGGGEDGEEPTYAGTLSIVGSSPRDITLRSFFLRLHMASGYPSETNVRWFWAVAVDLMFASMVFWGLSGVFMWWQIRRTRRIGFILLVASAIAALWLAIGMHWQILNS